MLSKIIHTGIVHSYAISSSQHGSESSEIKIAHHYRYPLYFIHKFWWNGELTVKPALTQLEIDFLRSIGIESGELNQPPLSPYSTFARNAILEGITINIMPNSTSMFAADLPQKLLNFIEQSLKMKRPIKSVLTPPNFFSHAQQTRFAELMKKHKKFTKMKAEEEHKNIGRNTGWQAVGAVGMFLGYWLAKPYLPAIPQFIFEIPLMYLGAVAGYKLATFRERYLEIAEKLHCDEEQMVQTLPPDAIDQMVNGIEASKSWKNYLISYLNPKNYAEKNWYFAAGFKQGYVENKAFEETLKSRRART